VILVWGIPGDDPLDAVLEALCAAGGDVELLDQSAPSKLETRNSSPNASAAYIRPQESAPDNGAADAALLAWADTTDAAVINRPAAMAANNSKPHQLAAIARAGFAVPDTLVTTDANEVRRFHGLHGRLVYKSVSGVRSIVAQLDPRRLNDLADVANCPTQFQQYIEGDDVRVHVVGDELFATLVRSDADDYRYARAGVEIADTTVPPEVGERCVAMAASMGLLVAGIDLRHATDGSWFCFEVNPSPAFTFYEHATGQPISAAIARLLIERDRPR
jgi:glutathione synthase/RimK-type ligase-like ATP-grasp enzyme